MKANIMTEKNKVKENLNEKINQDMQETSSIIIFMGLEHTNGLMEENMLGNGLITKCTVMAFLRGQTADNIKVNIKKIKKKDTGNSLGRMVENTLEIGRTANSTKVEYLLWKVENRKRASG